MASCCFGTVLPGTLVVIDSARVPQTTARMDPMDGMNAATGDG